MKLIKSIFIIICVPIALFVCCCLFWLTPPITWGIYYHFFPLTEKNQQLCLSHHELALKGLTIWGVPTTSGMKNTKVCSGL